MKLLYEYVDKTIKSSTIRLQSSIDKLVKANIDGLIFEDTKDKTKETVDNGIKNLLTNEFSKLFVLGQIHGIDAVQRNDNKTKEKTEFNRSYKNIANFANRELTPKEQSIIDNANVRFDSIEAQLQYIERLKINSKLKRINQKEFEGRKRINTISGNELIRKGDTRDLISTKTGVIPTPIQKLTNFKQYLGQREKYFGKSISDGYLELFPSYPKEIRNKMELEGREKTIKLEIEKETAKYIKQDITNKTNKNVEAGYITNIKKLLNITKDGDYLEKKLKELEGKRGAQEEIKRQYYKESKINEARVTKIAVTELRAAYSIGRILSYAKMGIQFVTWSAEPEHLRPNGKTHNPKSRETGMKICSRCQAMDGQVVPIQAILSSSFITSKALKGELIQPFLPNHPFCACVYLPIQEDLVQGNKLAKIDSVNEGEELVKQNNNLLGKALGVASGVASIGFLVYALRGDLREFVANGLMDASVKGLEIKSTVEKENKRLNIDTPIPEQFLQLTENLERGAIPKEVAYTLTNIAPIETKLYQEAINTVIKEQEDLAIKIELEDNLIDEYSKDIRRLSLEMQHRGDITNSLSELISIKAKIEKTIKELEKLRYKYSNSVSFLTKTENDLSVILDSYLKNNKVNPETEAFFRSQINKAEQLQDSVLAPRLSSSLDNLRTNINQINTIIATIKNNKSVKEVASKLEQEAFGTSKVITDKQVSSKVTSLLVKTVESTEEFKEVFSNYKLIKLRNSLTNLRSPSYELTLAEYNSIKSEVTKLKQEIDKLEKVISSLDDLDLELLKKSSNNKRTKDVYKKIATLKVNYLKHKELAYELDYALERTRKIKLNPNITEKMVNIRVKENILTNLETSKKSIVDILGGVLPSKELNKTVNLINLIDSEIKGIDKAVNTADKLRRLNKINKDIDTLERITLNTLTDGNAKLIISDKLNEYRESYNRLRNLYENLQFKRYSSLAEFNKESIINTESLLQMVNYVRKFPAKYTRLNRLF